MAKILKLHSENLKKLNEVIQKLTLCEGAKLLKSPMLEADGKFTSIIDSETDFNRNIVNGIDVEEEENQELKSEKTKLVKEITSKLKQALINNDEINKLLNKVNKIDSETKDNEWILNDIGNTASLKSKNAKIFKQNDNLCLSVDGNIHLFGSVHELHDWLDEHNLPVPKNIRLTEASNLDRLSSVDELPKEGNKLGDTKQVSTIISGIPLTVTYEWNGEKWKEKQDPAQINNEKDNEQPKSSISLKDQDSDVQKFFMDAASNPNKELDDLNVYLNSIFGEDVPVIDEIPTEECVTTGTLGAPVQYLGDKKENSLQEDWPAPKIFGLIDQNNQPQKFKTIIDGSRAICKMLAQEQSIVLGNSVDHLELTQEEFDRWEQLADQFSFVISNAIPILCRKAANDYVNESIEKIRTKNPGLANYTDEQLIPLIQNKVKALFYYDLSEEQVKAMLLRNSDTKDVNIPMDQRRTPEQQALVKEAKIAMGESKALRDEAEDEIFGGFSGDGRVGYAKYKKFVVAKNANNIVITENPNRGEFDPNFKLQKVGAKTLANKTTEPTVSADSVYKMLFNNDFEGASSAVATLNTDQQEALRKELIAKNPRLEKFLDRIFPKKESALIEEFLKNLK